MVCHLNKSIRLQGIHFYICSQIGDHRPQYAFLNGQNGHQQQHHRGGSLQPPQYRPPPASATTGKFLKKLDLSDFTKKLRIFKFHVIFIIIINSNPNNNSNNNTKEPNNNRNRQGKQHFSLNSFRVPKTKLKQWNPLKGDTKYEIQCRHASSHYKRYILYFYTTCLCI